MPRRQSSFLYPFPERTDFLKVNRTNESSHSVFFLNFLINLLAMNGRLLRSFNPQPYLLPLNFDDADLYVITNGNAFS